MVTGVTTSNMMQSNVIGTTAAVPQHKETMPIKSDRRSNKPIMEKRRRARINNCLNELKTLILDATKKDPSRHSKLEKADILEKTVKHLQELQRQQAAMQQATDPKVLNKFKAGFVDCANEVSRFPGLDPITKRRLLQHLSNCLNGVKTELHQHQRQHLQVHTQILPSPPSSPEQQDHQQQHQMQTLSRSVASPSYTVQQTPNGYFLPNGLQVIPTKLPNGSVALVLPQSVPQQSVSPHHHQQPQQQQQQQHPHTHTQQQQQLPQQQQTALAAKLQQHPMIVPIPMRTASTSSASSQASSTCVYEYSIPSNGVAMSSSYTPPSPANSYEATEYKPTVIQHASSATAAYMNAAGSTIEHATSHQENVQPLSLVVRKDIIKEEEQPWRPW